MKYKNLQNNIADRVRRGGQKTKGQVMITAIFFFVLISITILLGLAGPVIRQSGIVSDLIRSRDSYFLAEAGVEDVVYRLKNKLPIVSGQEVFINGFSARSTVTDSPGGKVITTEANWSGNVRKIETKLNAGIGVAFNYGVQVGNGGLELENNAGIIGNVYSNGSIEGSSGVFITGSAFAADSIPLTTDQSNLAPIPPPNWINFRNTSSSQDVAQSFQVSSSSPIKQAQFYIKKTGNPSNATVRITTDNSGSPSNNTITTGTLIASQVTGSYSLVNAVFSDNEILSPSIDYWLVIDSSSQSSNNFYTVGANDSYTSGVAKVGKYNGTWSSTNPSGLDAYFSISLGGVTATIDSVTVGTEGVGDAWADTVTNSTIRGNLYCQTGSGNNKACDTSQSNPTPQPFPISDGNIAQWKDDAVSGGTINGSVSVVATSTSLGPVKITGDLSLDNGAILVVTGTIWVQGQFIITNNSEVNLFSGFGTDSGLIIVDGKTDISNNVQFNGSGETGSYLMLLSTSDCPLSVSCSGSRAVTLGNNAGAVIINAQKGSVRFSNNSGAKEAVANKLELENNATITYESGLADVNFSSGPSGGWDIISWKEIE